MREVLYCDECGARLNLYVVGVCSLGALAMGVYARVPFR